MEVGEMRSSSIDLSSAPSSDIEVIPAPSYGAPRYPSSASAPAPYPSGNAYNNSNVTGVNAPATQAARQDLLKQKKSRKTKDPSASASDASKPKVQRKPRAAPGTAATSRKKPKLENNDAQPAIRNIPTSTPTDLQSSRLVEPYSFANQPNPQPKGDEAAKFSPNGFLRPEPSMHTTHPQSSAYSSNQLSPPQPQSQSSSTRTSAAFDPVRSITNPTPAGPPQPPPVASSSLATPPRPTSRPGASPIANLIDGPMPGYPSAPSPLRTYVTLADQTVQPSAPTEPSLMTASSGPMEVDASCTNDSNAQQAAVTKKSSSDAGTRASSPKPARAKEQPAPLPTGSGLLSASMFGGESGFDSNNKDDAAKAPNIHLYIDLKDPKNKVINFARLAEERYGFDALYPRQAAQRKRLNEVAARGAALERSASGSKFGGTSAGESGEDDVSVDIDRDSENDGDVAMSGVNGAEQVNSGTDGPELKRKRRKKVEDYDQDDPFIDDSEQIWEQQAAASKDGFFVYCGPLVPEGEKPAVERADGTVKRGGRGRGRGGARGSRGGRGAAAAAVHAVGEGETARPASGPGSRGGATTRKPRVRKADRAQMEQEKAAREKSSLIPAKPLMQTA